MKIKSLLRPQLFALALVVSFGVVLLHSVSSYATSGNFKWIDQETIRADNVLVEDLVIGGQNYQSVDFKGRFPTYTATFTYRFTNNTPTESGIVTSMDCQIQATITVAPHTYSNADVVAKKTGGSLPDDCADKYSGHITIADTDKNGPGVGQHDAATTKAITDAMQTGLNQLHSAYMAQVCSGTPRAAMADCQSGAQSQWEATVKACTDSSITGMTSADIQSAMTDCMVRKMPTQALKDEAKKDLSGVGAAIDANNTGNDKGANDQKTSCKPTGIGWILCPVSNAVAGMVDGLFSVVTSLMKVQPILGSGDYQKNLMTAWGVMRNIANIAFAIAFLYIIFSQLSGIGVNNYGIKKMLPRLIIGALLVNLSFYICAIFVDLSNISGVALQDLLMGLRSHATSSLPLDSGSEIISNITAGILAGTGIVIGATVLFAIHGTIWAAVGALLVLLLPALLALVTVFLVLLLRQALIIVFIIISPLAFVAYLLPNTESWFRKWLDAFGAMLVMFPLLSLVFGGSQLAAAFIMAAAQGTSGDNMVGFFLYLGGVFIQIIPLFIAPVLMKVSSGLLTRFGGIINNPNKGPFDRMRKGIQGATERSSKRAQSNFLRNGGGGVAGAYARFRFRRQAIHGRVDENLKHATTDYIADSAAANLGDNAFARQLSGGDEKIRNAVVASALALKEKSLKEEVSNMEALVKVKFDNPAAALEDAINRNDGIQAKAAQNLLYAQGSGGINTFRNVVTNNQAAMKEDVSHALSENTLEVHGQTTKANALDVLDWAKRGGRNISASTQSADTYKGKSPEELATQTGVTLANAFRSGGLEAETAKAIFNNKNTYNRLDNEQKAAIEAALGMKKGQGITSAQETALKENQERLDKEIAQAWDEAHDVEIERARQNMEKASDRHVQEMRDRFGMNDKQQ